MRNLGLLLFLSLVPAWTQNPTPRDNTEANQTADVDKPKEADKPKTDTHNEQMQDARDKMYFAYETEHIKPLGKKLFRNILLDQKDIWTSPFRMSRDDAVWWIGIGAAAGALIATDKHTINAFENSQGQVTWGNNISNIGAAYTLIPLVAGFYGYGAWKDNPKAREVGVLGAEALLDSLITVQVLKSVTRRNRPDDPEPGKWWGGGSSFPSGHSMMGWALASVIGHEYGRKNKTMPIIAYSLATVVSLSRFAAQKHYASDILVGGSMGWFIGRYVYQTHVNHAAHHHAWTRPLIMPTMDPNTRTFGVAMTIPLSNN
jgi:membrane-associated phospholipid phosphatase